MKEEFGKVYCAYIYDNKKKGKLPDDFKITEEVLLYLNAWKSTIDFLKENKLIGLTVEELYSIEGTENTFYALKEYVRRDAWFLLEDKSMWSDFYYAFNGKRFTGIARDTTPLFHTMFNYIPKTTYYPCGQLKEIDGTYIPLLKHNM